MWLLREFLENQLMAIFWRMFRKKVRPKRQFHGPCEQEPVERTGVYGLSFKAQGSMEATRSSSQLHTHVPPKNHTFRISETSWLTSVCFTNKLPEAPDGPWISELAHYNIPQDTHLDSVETKTPKIYSGRVKGLEFRAIPILEPWEFSPGGGILDTVLGSRGYLIITFESSWPPTFKCGHLFNRSNISVAISRIRWICLI